MSTKLHVGNVPSTVVESDLATTFDKFGPVGFVEIATDSFTGIEQGVCHCRSVPRRRC